MMTNRNILYRIYDSSGALLYIGATTNPGRRIQTHAYNQPWWDEAFEIKLERFDTAEELARAEMLAIEFEHPKYNWIHTGVVRPWSNKPRRRRGDGTLFQRADGMWIGRIDVPSGCDGRLERRQVSSKDRLAAEQKMVALKAQYGID